MKPLRFPAARFGCGLIRGDLNDEALEMGTTPALLELHLETCLACQADVGPGRQIAAWLARLAKAADERAPIGFVDRVLADLGSPTLTERRHRLAVVGWSAAGAVSAAAATVAVVIARRGRPAAIG